MLLPYYQSAEIKPEPSEQAKIPQTAPTDSQTVSNQAQESVAPSPSPSVSFGDLLNSTLPPTQSGQSPPSPPISFSDNPQPTTYSPRSSPDVASGGRRVINNQQLTINNSPHLASKCGK